MTEEIVNLDRLHPVQNEINGKSVLRVIKKASAKGCNPSKKPLLLAKDYSIIDGHHRWAASTLLEKPVNVAQSARHCPEYPEGSQDLSRRSSRYTKASQEIS